jgi:UDP-N-acetylglucosamine diphosphorylase/glucosamine-1-phosphate N-acetyltransferase
MGLSILKKLIFALKNSMNYILFDGPYRDHLLPLTYTKPVADLRIGILTIREKWEKLLETTTTTVTEDYLSGKFPMVEMAENIMICGSVLPTPELALEVRSLTAGQALYQGDELLAFYSREDEEVNPEESSRIDFGGKLIIIRHAWDLFRNNGEALESDFELITRGRESAHIPEAVHCINKERIFLEDGVEIEFGVLNAKKGPIYIGRNAEVHEGSMIRGPFAMGEYSVVKMGAKVYGPTTLGPKCKIGGEVNNAIMSGYCSKGHDGYLGNAVIGEWCNMGADSNNSNLKNTYAEVKMWDYAEGRFVRTGLQFCGLIMGDHSKSAINTMFNTGTVVGVSSNIYGANFPRNFVPSFSWGGALGFKTYTLNKAIETAVLVTKRKNEDFTEEDRKIFEYVFELSSKYRKK